MSMGNLPGCLLVLGWLAALRFREKRGADLGQRTFNLTQLGIGALTILAIGSLIAAISQGLLGHPDMNIIGNGSYSGMLRWYQDNCASLLPRAWIVSIPMLVYRLAMLAWALWISFTLIGLLKWGWNIFSQPLLWHTIVKKKQK
jgi:hypothetical protein